MALVEKVESPYIRAFLALPLAQAFQAEVGSFIDVVRKKFAGVRWVKATEIHITLHFFGTTNADKIPLISDAVKPVTKNSTPIKIFLNEIGAFPNAHKPRIIWLGTGGEVNSLKLIRKSIESNLSKYGFPCETREFTPHLTLGRVKDGSKIAGIENVSFPETQGKEIYELVLFRSRLTPQGAFYEKIETYPFSSS